MIVIRFCLVIWLVLFAEYSTRVLHRHSGKLTPAHVYVYIYLYLDTVRHNQMWDSVVKRQNTSKLLGPLQ